MFTPFKPGTDAAPPPPDEAARETAALRAEVERLRRELAAKEGKKG
jgi:hypothetical protein